MLIFIQLLAAVSIMALDNDADDEYVDNHAVTKIIGCFKANSTNMELIGSDVDGSDGGKVEWQKFGEAINSLVSRCADISKQKNFTYCAIRNYYECWAGTNHTEIDSIMFNRTEMSDECVNRKLHKCRSNSIEKCVGKAQSEYIYSLLNDGKELCDRRPKGSYPLKDSGRYLCCMDCNNQTCNQTVKSCDGKLVYDMDKRACVRRSELNKERFCEFRADGNWASPWDCHEKIRCLQGRDSLLTCNKGFAYNPVTDQCILESNIAHCTSIDCEFINRKVACLKENSTQMDKIIKDQNNNLTQLELGNFTESVDRLICSCSRKAKHLDFTYFSIRNFSECWAGKNDTERHFALDEPSMRSGECIDRNREPCNDEDAKECIGQSNSEYIYIIETYNNFTNVTVEGTNNDANMEIAVGEFIDLLQDNDIRLIDVGDPETLKEEGKIDGSLNIPLPEVDAALKLSEEDFKTKYGVNKPAYDDCKLVFYCRVCRGESLRASRIARENGYKCPKAVKGGYTDWKYSGSRSNTTLSSSNSSTVDILPETVSSNPTLSTSNASTVNILPETVSSNATLSISNASTVDILPGTVPSDIGVDLINASDLESLLQKGNVNLIDVRNSSELYEEGVIPESIHIPMNEVDTALHLSDEDFKTKYGTTKPAKDDCNLVFYCSSGVRSLTAAQMAKDSGYRCPKLLDGGVAAWKTYFGILKSIYTSQ